MTFQLALAAVLCSAYHTDNATVGQTSMSFARKRLVMSAPRGPSSGGAATSSAALAERDLEGYDNEFVNDVAAKYECPICLMVLRDPMQTACGHRFCRLCIQQWLREKSFPKCPVDNIPLSSTQLFPDNFAKREIMLLSVKCPNCKHGCPIVCELKQLENHLELECEYVLVPCPNQCLAVVFKGMLSKHMTEECTKRYVKCRHCQQQVTCSEREVHMAQCLEMEIQCEYCSATLLRKDMTDHHSSLCQKAPTDCLFSPFGCKVKLPREEMDMHLRSSLQSHLVFLSETVSKLLAAGHYPSVVGGATVVPTAKMPDAPADGLVMNLAILEPQALATNVTSGFGTLGTSTSTQADGRLPLHTEHFSEPIGAHVKASDYHNLLERTRHQDLTLAKHEEQVASLQTKVASYELELQRQNAKLKSYEQSISDFESRMCNGQFLWKVQGYSQLRHDAMAGDTTAVHSPGFYTSFYGYKLCIRLNPNGVETGTGTHISLFIHFMKGAHDGIVDWPFIGKITLFILDQNENSEYRQHISETLVAKPGLTAFQRPLSSRNHKGFGYIEFAPVALIERGSYLKNDTLLIRAVVVEH